MDAGSRVPVFRRAKSFAAAGLTTSLARMLPTSQRFLSASNLGCVRAIHSARDSLYIGANLPLVSSKGDTSEIEQKEKDQQQPSSSGSSCRVQGGATRGEAMEGMPFKRLADYLGEKMWPVLQEVKLEDKKRRMEARNKNAAVFEPPSIPHFLPLTKWMAKSQAVRETLVVDQANRQKARLSWYHPDDTMVPRDWFRGGLWEDLKYYRPFMSKKE